MGQRNQCIYYAFSFFSLNWAVLVQKPDLCMTCKLMQASEEFVVTIKTEEQRWNFRTNKKIRISYSLIVCRWIVTHREHTWTSLFIPKYGKVLFTFHQCPNENKQLLYIIVCCSK